MTHPESYYDAKRALLVKAHDLAPTYGYYDLAKNIPHILAALGWDEPQPATDDRGKPVKVWRLPVKGALPGDVHQRLADASHERAKANRVRWDFEPKGVVIAATKAAALDLVYGPDRKSYSRPKTTDVGEVAPTDLAYEAAAFVGPGWVVVTVSELEHEAVPLAALRHHATAGATP
jgi:hypothetical protein